MYAVPHGNDALQAALTVWGAGFTGEPTAGLYEQMYLKKSSRMHFHRATQEQRAAMSTEAECRSEQVL